jgi:hypothetical protein
MRALLQSTESGRFLAPDADSGCATWVRSLKLALQGGVIEDEEHLAQLIEDHCEPGCFDVVNLPGDEQ